MRSFFSKRIGIIILTIIILAATLVALSSCIQSGDSDDGQEPDDEQETNDGQDQSEPEYTPTEGLSYILNEDESGYTVSGIGTATDTDIVIPSEYNGLPVTGIGSWAFYACASLTSIAIPDSVTSIGYGAFESCASLTSVTMGNGVTTIGSYAFAYCDSLISIVIPDSVTRIGIGAFVYCHSLTSVTIPDSVTSIGVGAFAAANSLINIAVDGNNSVYASKDGNLYNKDKTTLIQYATGKTATEFTIPDSVTSISSSAFHGCTSLTSIVIPDSVTSIGEAAFSGCTSLKSVTIGNGVTSIGGSAFYKCTSLKSVTIGNGVTSISSSAFADCTSLTSIIVDQNNTAYASIDGNLYNKDKTTLIQYAKGKTATEFTIPDGVTSIGDSAFAWCDSLTSVTIPDSVTSIGYSAYDSCYSLTDVYYGGTEEQWNGISIGSENEDLTLAIIHFSTEPDDGQEPSEPEYTSTEGMRSKRKPKNIYRTKVAKIQ